jgi:hypothetical protein
MISRLAIGPNGIRPDGKQVGLARFGVEALDGGMIWEAAQPTGVGTASVYALAIDRSGDVFAGGFANRLGVTKKSGSSGALLWQRPFGITPDFYSPTTAVRALRVDQNGDIVVTENLINGYHYRAYLAKYAGTDGALRWERRSKVASTCVVVGALDPSGDTVALDSGLVCKYAGTSGYSCGNAPLILLFTFPSGRGFRRCDGRRLRRQWLRQ